jgi:hypothetical protein
MFFSALLPKAGFVSTTIRTTAVVQLDEGPTITLIELDCEGGTPAKSRG